MMRRNFNNRDASGSIQVDRSTHADLDPLVGDIPFYQPESRTTWYRLPEVRPSVLSLAGATTEVALDDIREGSRIACTGIGGSGGIVGGRVRNNVFEAQASFSV